VRNEIGLMREKKENETKKEEREENIRKWK